MNQVRSEASSSGSNNSNVSSPVAKDFTSHRILYPISETPSEGNRVKWIGLHPLEMVDQIMSMTNHSANARSATHSIDEVFMKRVPSTTPADARCESLVRSILDRTKDERNKDVNDQLINLGQTTQPFSMLISAVANHKQLLRVANDFEAMATTNVMPSYHRVQAMCLSNISAGTTSHDSNADHVISETIGQVEALMEMVLSARAGSSQHVSSTTKPIAVLPSSIKKKNEMFQTKMSNWLLQNWTNPFPDTAALNFLANHLLQAQCIVVKDNDAHVPAGKTFEERQCYMIKKACKKIETYLVNSRLRKWRKSIEDAFDLRRPAYLLLEDSLRLCEGKELRPIEGWNSHELFASHDRYSLPLNTWRKKVVKKRRAKGTVTAKAGAWHVTPKRQRCASPKELSAGDGLIELAKGLKVMSTCERKSSPSDVVVKVGGMGLSPFNIAIGPALEEDARNKMKKGTFFI
eukprot:scaffold12264_cov118-Skeletonema_dohrnii-CCMP3373.AAC.8